jgi:hypothetical protein
MHVQIKAAIGSLKFPQGLVEVTLGAGQTTPLGKLVGRIYYQTDVLEVLDRNERWGYPHNGGQHTLTLRCKPKDAVSLIELIKETVLEKLTFTDEERQVANELSYISQEILAGARKM